MLRIGICDDEKIIQDELKDMVSHIVFQYGEVEFSTFSSGKDVVKAVEEKTFTCDLLLLDIHMPERDGIETAKYIRMHQVDVDIIFVTVSKEHVFDGYTYQAFSYLLKPIQYPRLEDELGRYIYERSKNSRCLHVNINGRKEKLLLDKVKYFEADTRKVIAHLLHGEVTFYAKLSDLQKVLESYDLFTMSSELSGKYDVYIRVFTNRDQSGRYYNSDQQEIYRKCQITAGCKKGWGIWGTWKMICQQCR